MNSAPDLSAPMRLVVECPDLWTVRLNCGPWHNCPAQGQLEGPGISVLFMGSGIQP